MFYTQQGNWVNAENIENLKILNSSQSCTQSSVPHAN